MKDVVSRENSICKAGRCERGWYIWEITSRFQGALNGTRVGMEYEIIGNEAWGWGRLNFNDTEGLDITPIVLEASLTNSPKLMLVFYV